MKILFILILFASPPIAHLISPRHGLHVADIVMWCTYYIAAAYVYDNRQEGWRLIKNRYLQIFIGYMISHHIAMNFTPLVEVLVLTPFMVYAYVEFKKS